MTMTVHPARAIVLIGAASAAAWWLASQGRAQLGPPLTIDSLVTAGVLLGGAVAAGSVALSTLAALAQSLLGWRPRAIGALPAPLRRFVVGSVAAAMAAGVAVPATAEDAYPGWAPTVPSPAASPTVAEASPRPSPSVAITEEVVVEPDRDPEPEREPESRPEPAPNPASPAREGRVHVVVRGDSLWDIAATALGQDATDAAIAAAWPAIYEANQSTIGDDPGLILPGQRLTIPTEVAA